MEAWHTLVHGQHEVCLFSGIDVCGLCFGYKVDRGTSPRGMATELHLIVLGPEFGGKMRQQRKDVRSKLYTQSTRQA